MSDFPVVETGENVSRQVLSDHPELMVVAFNFASKDAEGYLHRHPHVQSTYVMSGKFRFFIDGDEKLVGPGDSFVISSNQEHGCVCVEPGTLIDSFTPRRDDFL